MSERRIGERDWRVYVGDMLDACEKLLAFTEGMDRAAFDADVRTNYAVVHCLTIIGEAATHVPEHMREAHPDIQWRAMMGMRNFIVHGYWNIDSDVVWGVVEDDIPALLPRLRALLAA